MKKSIYRSIVVTVFMFIILGGIYPLITTLVGSALFFKNSTGGIIYKNNEAIGAHLIGQNFYSAKYFQGRPSAAGNGYDAQNSSAQNLSMTNQALMDRMENDIQKWIKSNPSLKRSDIPIDLLTASGSGLDPDISVPSALIQITRIAKVRRMSEDAIKNIVTEAIQKPSLGIIGTKHVNVLELNLALDKASEKTSP